MTKNMHKQALHQWFVLEAAAKRAASRLRRKVKTYETRKQQHEEAMAQYKRLCQSGKEFDVGSWMHMLDHEHAVLCWMRDEVDAIKTEAKKARLQADAWQKALMTV